MRPKSHLAVCLRLLRCRCGVNTGRRSTLERIQQAKPQSLGGRTYSLPRAVRSRCRENGARFAREPICSRGRRERTARANPEARSDLRKPYLAVRWRRRAPVVAWRQDPLLRYNTLSVVEGFRWSQSLISVLG